MKKLFVLLSVLLLVNFCAVQAMAESPSAAQDISVEISSPKAIDSRPVHDDNIEITVTNNGSAPCRDLSCYLTIVDVGRSQTYPVDEFGENAYQTRTIPYLAPGGKPL